MKQTFFALLTLILAGAVSTNAQEAMAVLKSGATTKTYNGSKALQSAYADAAESGDVITLSSGTFLAVPEIAKSVTIRGAGAYIDNTYKTQPTFISGNFAIGKPSVTIEGIAVAEKQAITLKASSPKFIKCKLQNIYYYEFEKDGKKYHNIVENAYFLHCQILSKVNCPTGSMTFINCQVYCPSTMNNNASTMTFRNCAVIFSGVTSHVYNSTFINSYVYCNDNSWYTNEYTTFTNCLFYPSSDKYRNGATPSYANCWSNNIMNNIFVEDSWYVFTDASKSKYVDEYGRQIGIRGGTFPWNIRMAGPHIKSMEVAPRSTADGKLRVKMTVESTGY